MLNVYPYSKQPSWDLWMYLTHAWSCIPSVIQQICMEHLLCAGMRYEKMAKMLSFCWEITVCGYHLPSICLPFHNILKLLKTMFMFPGIKDVIFQPRKLLYFDSANTSQMSTIKHWLLSLCKWLVPSQLGEETSFNSGSLWDNFSVIEMN